MKPRRGHESTRDRLIRSKRSLDFYADMAGKPRMDVQMPPEPKRRAPAGADGKPLESDIQRTIIDGLRWHPLVAMVERINSGAAVEYNADGSARYIEFSRVEYAANSDAKAMRAVDISATLRDGKRFVIEVKRPPFRGPRNERERAQAAYIEHVIRSNGYGMFATCWPEVAGYLGQIKLSVGTAAG